MKEGWVCPLCGRVMSPFVANCTCRAEKEDRGQPIITSITLKPDPKTGLVYGRFRLVQRREDGAVGLFDVIKNTFIPLNGATCPEEKEDADG